MEKRDISIISQVVYKEMEQKQKDLSQKDFWEEHYQKTLALARNIIRIDKTINKNV